MKTLLIGGLLAILVFHFHPVRAEAQQKPSIYAPQAANCYNLLPAPICDLWLDTLDWITTVPTTPPPPCGTLCQWARDPDGWFSTYDPDGMDDEAYDAPGPDPN
jgi:hypothetical protein